MYIQHSLSYAFHLNWLTFLEAMTDVLWVHFLSGHGVCGLVRVAIDAIKGLKRGMLSTVLCQRSRDIDMR